MGSHGSQGNSPSPQEGIIQIVSKTVFLTHSALEDFLSALSNATVESSIKHPLLSLLCVCVHTISLSLLSKALPFLQDTPQTLLEFFPGSHPHSQGGGNPFLSLFPKSLVCYFTSQIKVLQ